VLLNFSKVVASGNDFIVVDNRNDALERNIGDLAGFAKAICKRRLSVGADGLLVLEESSVADFKMRIFNPDGSEVTMCGNGIRASALYALKNGWSQKSMKIETGAGILEAEAKEEDISVKMTPPKETKLEQLVGVGKAIMEIHSINTGVPHAVHFVEELEGYPVKEAGSKIRYHKVFSPEGTNVDFVKKIDDSTISVRTYERGVEDETLACGTGVTASAVISSIVNGTKSPVKVNVRSGDTLKVYFKKERNNFRDLYLEGKAHIVFEGGFNYV